MLSIIKSASLNAPSGAGCFLTESRRGSYHVHHRVLMHLVVLGAF